MNDGPSRSESPSLWKRLTARFNPAPRTEEDIKEMIADAAEGGVVDEDSAEMIEGVFETREMAVRDIMVPRSQIIAIDSESSLEEVVHAVAQANHSRYPVFGETRDEVIGILLAKDLLRFASGKVPFDLKTVVRPVVVVPDSLRVNQLLKDFKRSRNHMALVADEYGGITGLVTIEDILEQIVGDIDDEHDEIEGDSIIQLDERRYLVSALTSLDDFNQRFNTEFDTDAWDTIGGLVIAQFGRVPRRGETTEMDGMQFSVQRADSRRIQQLQVQLAQ